MKYYESSKYQSHFEKFKSWSFCKSFVHIFIIHFPTLHFDTLAGTSDRLHWSPIVWLYEPLALSLPETCVEPAEIVKFGPPNQLSYGCCWNCFFKRPLTIREQENPAHIPNLDIFGGFWWPWFPMFPMIFPQSFPVVFPCTLGMSADPCVTAAWITCRSSSSGESSGSNSKASPHLGSGWDLDGNPWGLGIFPRLRSTTPSDRLYYAATQMIICYHNILSILEGRNNLKNTNS
jgi:hypothetical protein